MPPLHGLTSRSSNCFNPYWRNTGTQTHHVLTSLLESFASLSKSLRDDMKLQAARGQAPAQRPHREVTMLYQASNEAGLHLHLKGRRLVSVVASI